MSVKVLIAKNSSVADEWRREHYKEAQYIVRSRAITTENDAERACLSAMDSHSTWVVRKGTLVNPEYLAKLVSFARKNGIRCYIDPETRVILPIHKFLDAARARIDHPDTSLDLVDGTISARIDALCGRSWTIGHILSRNEQFESDLEAHRYWAELFAISSVLEAEKIDFRSLDLAFHPLHRVLTAEWCLQWVHDITPFIRHKLDRSIRLNTSRKNVIFDYGMGGAVSKLAAMRQIEGSLYMDFSIHRPFISMSLG